MMLWKMRLNIVYLSLYMILVLMSFLRNYSECYPIVSLLFFLLTGDCCYFSFIVFLLQGTRKTVKSVSMVKEVVLKYFCLMNRVVCLKEKIRPTQKKLSQRRLVNEKLNWMYCCHRHFFPNWNYVRVWINAYVYMNDSFHSGAIKFMRFIEYSTHDKLCYSSDLRA